MELFFTAYTVYYNQIVYAIKFNSNVSLNMNSNVHLNGNPYVNVNRLI